MGVVVVLGDVDDFFYFFVVDFVVWFYVFVFGYVVVGVMDC